MRENFERAALGPERAAAHGSQLLQCRGGVAGIERALSALQRFEIGGQ